MHDSGDRDRTEQALPRPAPGARPDRSLPRSKRLVESRAFRETFEGGQRHAGRFMVFWLRRGPNAGLRLGVVAAKRTFRRAVDRSRAKRLLREAFRLNRWRLAGDVDVILVARRDLLRASLEAVEKDLMDMARRAGLATRQETE